MSVKVDFLLKRGEGYSIRISGQETEAVKIAAENLKKDLYKTLGVVCSESKNEPQIFIGTLGFSEEIDRLVDISKMQDRNGVLQKETYLHYVSNGNLIIAGSDRRGTIYGIYELSEMLGVSPFYFWADVPVKERQEFRLKKDYEKVDYPSVEYRGIFINDEEELEVWVKNYMGENTIGIKTYEKIFELLLRLKGNYIWPAMHVNSFNVIPENGALAERMGIVVGTSHCDMLMRSNNREWKPWIEKKGYIDAKYDYSIQGKNREILQEYWRESVEQNKNFEVCYTLGMRGIHDSGFETRELEKNNGNAGSLTDEEKKQAKVELLSKIIRDQQKILRQTLKRDTMTTFIPYKEVLELYDSGLEVPEEVTLVWTNDNYGYIRRYPSDKEKSRKGGNGIYYHNSYWAPPSMSYVFLCSIPLAHTKNELRKAYEEGIRKLWVINIGAMKPLEQEIAFFLRLAWEIGKENAITENVDVYVEDWINRTFSSDIGKETAALLNDFSQLTNVRKLENMNSNVFSQTAYGDEAVVRIHEYEKLFEKGNSIYNKLDPKERDAFFQIVLLRIHAAYFTNLQFYYGDRSTLMFERGEMQAASHYTKKAKEFDDVRRKLLLYYNQVMAKGKWNGILDPEGFPPPRTAMLPICTPSLFIGKQRMIVNIWNDEEKLTFVKPSKKWIEIGNGGEGQFDFWIEDLEWITLSERSGTVQTEKRILVEIKDVSQNRKGSLIIHNQKDGSSITIPVEVQAFHTSCINIEEDGKLVIEADSVSLEKTGFHLIKRLGRGKGNLVEVCTSKSNKLLEQEKYNSSHGLCYCFYLTDKRNCLLEIHRFPSLNSTGHIRVGVCIDEGQIQVVESFSTDEWRKDWKKNVLDNVDRLYLDLQELQKGEHSIRFFPIDPYFAFSRFVIYTKERKANNYIGIEGDQTLPKEWDTTAWIEEFYGEITLKPRPVLYTKSENETDNFIQYETEYGKEIDVSWYLKEGENIFEEREGTISIDAASVLAQSRFAYTSDCWGKADLSRQWQHCSSESYGRSGLAMYIKQGLQKETSALNYRFRCSGGHYTIWLFAKFDTIEESYFGMGIDSICWEKERLYKKGCLWGYEAEQVYRWVVLGQTDMIEGEHILQLYSPVSGLRFDRVYLTKGSELPPMDREWRTNGR